MKNILFLLLVSVLPLLADPEAVTIHSVGNANAGKVLNNAALFNVPFGLPSLDVSGLLVSGVIPFGSASGTVAQGNDTRFPAGVTGVRWSAGAGSTDVSASQANLVSVLGSYYVTPQTTLAGYGITDGVSLTGSQTLINKTLTSPIINGTLSGTAFATGVSAALAITPNTVGGFVTKIPRVFYVSAYGGKFDELALTDAVYTSGSPNLSSASATFTNADVGKTVVLENSITARQTLTISTVTDSTHIVMSGNASASSSAYVYGITRYGTDNKTSGSGSTDAVQNTIAACATGGGGVVQFDGGSFLDTSTPLNTGTINAIWAIPYSPTITGAAYNIEIRGTGTPLFSFFNPGQYPSWGGGTVLDCPNQTVTGTHPAIFAVVGTTFTGLYWGSANTSLNINHLTIRQPPNPAMDYIQDSLGGSLVVDYVSLDQDTPYSQSGNLLPNPSAGAATGIICPSTLSAYYSWIGKVYVYGANTGIQIGDTTDIDYGVFEMCQFAITGSSTTNSLSINFAQCNRCTVPLSSNATMFLTCQHLGAEIYQGGATFVPSWCQNNNGGWIIDDYNKTITGTANVSTVVSNVGAAQSSVRAPSDGSGVALTVRDLYSNTILTETTYGSLTVGSTFSTAAPTLAVAGTTGSTTYSYVIVYYLLDKSVIVTPVGTVTNANATLSSTNKITISQVVPRGAAGNYAIYRTVAGGTPSTTGKISSGYAASTLSIVDNGLAGDSTATPTDTSGKITATSIFVSGSATLGSGTGIAKLTSGVVGLATAGADYSLITVQTGTLVGGTATKTVPSGSHPWVQDNASSLTNVGSLVVTVSGTTATITSTNVLDTSPFTLFNAGSQ